MFFPEGQVRVFLYGQPVSMRLSFDGLYALARHNLQQDPLTGNLFAFINRRATQIKVLYFDRTGWCVWAKRLEQGRLTCLKRSMRFRTLPRDGYGPTITTGPTWPLAASRQNKNWRWPHNLYF
jgi:hypothetical protein